MFLGLTYSNKEAWKEADDYYQRVIDRFIEEGLGNSPLLIDTYTNKAVAGSASAMQKSHSHPTG